MKALLPSQSQTFKSKASKLLISWLSATYFLPVIVTLISGSVIDLGLFGFVGGGFFLLFVFSVKVKCNKPKCSAA